MRSILAGLLVLAAGPVFAQTKMQVTWPNGGVLVATATAADDSGDQSILVKTTGFFKYDMLGNSPPGFPVVVQASLRVKFTNDGRASVRWYGNGLWGEAGTTFADGSAPFTVKLIDKNNVNNWKIVTVTPIP